jgi:hypothetical protein
MKTRDELSLVVIPGLSSEVNDDVAVSNLLVMRLRPMLTRVHGKNRLLCTSFCDEALVRQEIG